MGINVNDFIFNGKMKGLKVRDDKGKYFDCTGIFKVVKIYDDGAMKLLCFSAKDGKPIIDLFVKSVNLKDENFIKYDINEALSKAMKEMNDRYEQLKSMKNKQTKLEVLEYCKKVEKNITIMIAIKRYVEKYHE